MQTTTQMLKKPLIALILLATGCNSSRIAELERENNDLKKAALKANLDSQEKCAKDAEEEFTSERWVSDASFTDHYSKALNKCFIRVQWLESRQKGPYPGQYLHVLLSDAFEKKNYAELHRSLAELNPLQCTVTLPSGQQKTCTSSREFEELISTYMDN